MHELQRPVVAAGLAERLLAPLGDRWSHTVGVAARAERLAASVPPAEYELLLASAWYHDIGYAPQLAGTGFHPLDGARHLVDRGCPERLCALVAHHSAALFEAEERGLADELARWAPETGAVADALWTADMTTGPRGDAVCYPERLTEILDRYGEDSVVGKAVTRARPTVEAALARTDVRLGTPGH